MGQTEDRRVEGGATTSPETPARGAATGAVPGERTDDAFRILLDSVDRSRRADLELLTLWHAVMCRSTTAALAAWGRLSADYLPWVERRLVLRARREGVSWSAIGRLIGRSRQSVQERHDRPMAPDELLPPRPLERVGEAEVRELRAASADRRRQTFADAASDDGDLVAW